jgi:riboflavin kinase / FMN adenylyltransferase
MDVFRILNEVKIGPSACAMGMFDGIHPGHHIVLEQAIRTAKIRNLASVVFTFANHPQSLLSQTPTSLLSTLEERLKALRNFGFTAALVLDFTPELRDLSPQAFVQRILVETLHVQSVSVGYDHRFGKNRKGDGAFLIAMGKRHGFDVNIIEPVQVDNQIVSSTLIRKLLSYGKLEKANWLLGYPYTLTGKVITGVGRGKSIGFPTANLEVPPDRLVPAMGVYAGTVQLQGEAVNRPALCNIGLAPTFGDQSKPRVEVYLLDYTGDLYGKTLTFGFLHHIREERTFPSTHELIAQLEQDCGTARSLLEKVNTLSKGPF